MCAFLTGLDVDGILLSPGYHYESIPGDEHFLFLEEIHQKFRRIVELAKRYRKISSTPLFLQFAAGLRDYPCTPWGNPTYTPKGWKGPCYLIEGQHYATWKEFFAASTGTTGRRARTRAATTARCTRASRRRSSASWASGSPTCSRWRAGSWRTCATRGGARRRLAATDELVGADVERALLRAAVALAVGRRRSGRRPGVPARRRRREVAGRVEERIGGDVSRRPGQRVDVGEGEGRRPPS